MSNSNISPAKAASKADPKTNFEQHEAHKRVLLRKMDALLMPLLKLSYEIEFVSTYNVKGIPLTMVHE
jgi:hypothetical protein